MATTNLAPYLNFDGNTQEAMEFYQQALGGKLSLQKFGDAKGMPVPPGYENKVLHARLEADAVVIMASEGHPGTTTKFGENVSLCLGGNDEAKLTKYYHALSAGGRIDQPLAKMFWGDMYAQFVDKFGVQWMVNISKS